MAVPTSKLSPERCQQLNESGVLRLLVYQLHEHTFEPHHQSEENTYIETFLFNFNRKSAQRQRLFNDIRTIVENTMNVPQILEVLDWLETLRDYTESLYSFLTNVPESEPEVDLPWLELNDLFEVSSIRFNREKSVQAYCTIIELFGGVYAILDLLRAQRRFVAMFQDQVDYGLMVTSFGILMNLCRCLNSRSDIKMFLVNSRSFNQLMVGILEEAKGKYSNYLGIVRHVANLIEKTHFRSKPEVTVRRFPYVISCGVIKCLTKLAMDIDDPQTRQYIMETLEALLDEDLENVREFCAIDGSIDMLIDILAPCEQKDNDLEDGYWYGLQRDYSVSLLYSIHELLMIDRPIVGAGRRLLEAYESRDIGAVLAYRIKRIISTELDASTRNLMGLLRFILDCSQDQRQKFGESEEAQEAVKRFTLSNDHETVDLATNILERCQ